MLLHSNLSPVILSKIADVGNSKTPTRLASANIGNGDPPYPPKTCRRLKWMVPTLVWCCKHVQCSCLITNKFWSHKLIENFKFSIFQKHFNYRGSHTSAKITNAVPYFHSFSLCTRKWGIFALVGDLLQSH